MVDDHPIDPVDYTYGVKVVDIGDIRVARGLSRSRAEVCKHSNMAYDSKERRVYCRDCEKGIHPFDAFLRLVENYHAAHLSLSAKKNQVDEALKFSLISRAAKNIDVEWRARNTAPACPHCHEALLPEDFADGVKTTVSKELARRKRIAKTKANKNE